MRLIIIAGVVACFLDRNAIAQQCDDPCTCLSARFPDIREGASCQASPAPTLEKLGLVVYEINDADRYVVAQDGTPLAALSLHGGCWSYCNKRTSTSVASKRVIGKHVVAWIVTTTESTSFVPDGDLGEATYTEELTVCVLGAHPKCPIAAEVLRQGGAGATVMDWSEATRASYVRRARREAKTEATVVVRGDGTIAVGRDRIVSLD